jgi:hypothetical protein
MSRVQEVAEAAGVRLIGAPGEVVALEDCEHFLAEAAACDLLVTGIRGVEVMPRGAVVPRFGTECTLPAAEVLAWGLLAGRRWESEPGEPRLGVEFALTTADELQAREAEESGTGGLSRKRRINWGAAPEVLLLIAAVGLTALLIWSVTTALSCRPL